MGKKKKETIRIIKREDTNKEDYTFVSNDNIVNNLKNNNESTTYTKLENKSDEKIEKKKIYSKKVDNKGRKILGKSMQVIRQCMNSLEFEYEKQFLLFIQ